MLLKHMWATVAVLLGLFQLTPSIELVFYYNKASLDDHERVATYEGSKIITSPNYIPSLPLFTYIFGFLGKVNTTSTINMVRAALETGLYNVVLVDWSQEASAITITEQLNPITQQASYVFTGLAGMITAASQLAKAFKSMVGAGLDIGKTFVTGHSLGAQLAGMTGKELKLSNLILGRICGLDPAGLFFDPAVVPPLRSGDAGFVYVILSDPGGYAVNNTNVDLNFRPNFKAFTIPDPKKNVQPGCPEGEYPKFTKNDTCSHDFCRDLFIASWKDHNLLGCKSNSFWDWQNGKECMDIVTIGNDIDKTKRGTYYLNTNAVYPYGKGVDGLHP